MFGPHWVWGLPLCFLVPVAGALRPRLLLLLGLASVFIVWPLMGPCLPWRTLLGSQTGDLRLRILTCNADFNSLDSTVFGSLLDEVQPDIVTMQDVSTRKMATVFGHGGWHVLTTDGLYLASRFPARIVETLNSDNFGPGPGAAARFDIETPAGIVHCFNIHLATPRWGLLAVVHRFWQGAEELQANSDLRRWQSTVISSHARECKGPVVLAGDFNTPVESVIYRKYWSSYINAFSVAGFGWGDTHLTRRTAVRIDHILAGPRGQVERCWVGPDVGSAHRPVIADLSWIGLGK